MTVRDLINMAGENWAIVLIALAAPPVAAFGVGLLVRRADSGIGSWRYLYSALVYVVCIPGMLAAVLTAYALFLTQQDLRDVNLLIYFGPIVSMGITLLLVRRH